MSDAAAEEQADLRVTGTENCGLFKKKKITTTSEVLFIQTCND